MKQALNDELIQQLRIVIVLTSILDGYDVQLIPSAFKALEEYLPIGPLKLSQLNIAQSICHCISGVFWGYMTERICRVKIVFTGLLLWSIFTILFSLCDSYYLMLVLRIFVGFALSSISPSCQSLIGEFFDESSRNEIFGRVQAIICTGMIISSIYSTTVSPIYIFGFLPGWKLVFFSSGLVGLTSAIFIYTKIILKMNHLAKVRVIDLQTPERIPKREQSPTKQSIDNEALEHPSPVSIAVLNKNTSLEYPGDTVFPISPISRLSPLSPNSPISPPASPQIPTPPSTFPKSKRTLLFLIIIGTINYIPVSSFSYCTLYFQTLRISNALASLLTILILIGCVLGSLLSVRLNRKMLSVLSPPLSLSLLGALSAVFSIILMWTSLQFIPRHSSSFHLYAMAMFCLGLVAIWFIPAISRPILIELVPPERRGRVFAAVIAVEGAIASFIGNFSVGYLSEKIFGYKLSREGGEGSAGGERNASAIANSLTFTTCVPWVCNFFLFLPFYFSYRRDRLRVQRYWESQRGSALVYSPSRSKTEVSYVPCARRSSR